MRLLITGGSGFIGTNVVEAALQAGHDVLSLDAAKPRNPDHAKVWQSVDLLDRAGLEAAVRDFAPTHIVHLGARTDLDEKRDIQGYAANTDGVANLLSACDLPGVERTIIASSMLVCRNGYRPTNMEDYCPDTLYGQSKVLTEQITRRSPPPHCWTLIRPTSIWGPWFDVPYKMFFLTVASGRYVHPGRARVDKAMGYVGNVVHQIFGILAADPERVHGRTFYVGDPEPTRLDEWAEEIREALGARPIRRLPMPVMRAVALAGDGLNAVGIGFPLTSFRLRNMLTCSSFDMRELSDIVGPLPFDRQAGTTATVAWLREQGQVR